MLLLWQRDRVCVRAEHRAHKITLFLYLDSSLRLCVMNGKYGYGNYLLLGKGSGVAGNRPTAERHVAINLKNASTPHTRRMSLQQSTLSLRRSARSNKIGIKWKLNRSDTHTRTHTQCIICTLSGYQFRSLSLSTPRLLLAACAPRLGVSTRSSFDYRWQ